MIFLKIGIRTPITLSGEIPYTCFAAKQSYLEKNPEVAEKFIRAIKMAYKFITTETPEEVASVLLPSFEGTTITELKIAVEQYKSINAWSSNMVLSEESFNRLMAVMLNAGVITERSNWADIVNNSIATRITV